MSDNVRLIKKHDRAVFRPFLGVKDYRKILNFQVGRNWIDKTPCCMCSLGKGERCIGYRGGDNGQCVFQVVGPYRVECTR